MTNKKIMIILLFLSFIAFAVIYYNLTMFTIQRYFLIGLLFIIPFIVIGIIYLLYFKSIINQKLATWFLVISIILSIILGFKGLVFISVTDLLSEVTDIKEYDRMLAFEKYTGYVDHFPEIIPFRASNIKFYYRPQVLQGGMEFQLKMFLPKENIEFYRNKYSNNCIKILDTNDIKSLNEFGIFTVGNYVSDKSILPDYTLYLIKNRQDMYNSWNHGAVAFIAISNNNNYLLFQTEIW